MVVNRDLVEIRGWAEELADDPAVDGHPQAAGVLATAAFAAYHHGDQNRADQRIRAGLDRGGSGYCLHAAAVIALERGAYDEVINLPGAPTPRSTSATSSGSWPWPRPTSATWTGRGP